MTRRAQTVGAASGILSPLVIAAIALLVLNDHWLKYAWAHPVTGKLSDFAGLVFFPLLLIALIEIGQVSIHRYRGPSLTLLVGCIAVTGAAFALVQVVPAATEAYRLGLGALQHPGLALDAALAGRFDAMPRVVVTPDVTDLLTLPVLVVPYAVGRRRCDGARSESEAARRAVPAT